MEIKTRIAPSPTGAFHIGTARTALFNYLYAKSEGGKFYLRFEDTDQSRNTKESEKDIVEGLKWLGIEYEDEVWYQTKRLSIYKKYVDKLLKDGKAYMCYCTKEELAEERRQQRLKKQPPKYSGKCLDLSEEEIKKFEEFTMDVEFMRSVKHRDALVNEFSAEYFGRDYTEDDPFLFNAELEEQINEISLEIKSVLGRVLKSMAKDEIVISDDT